MRAKIGQWVQNLMMSLLSLLVCFLVLEFIVFRFVLVPDDVLPNVSINNVVRYQPGREAVFRHPDGSQTRISINDQGWNSTKPHYQRQKTPGRLRVAVVGDSYVHSAFVNPESAFPEVLERELVKSGVDAEVYRFGMDGAPLSQYLHVLRREVRQFNPDIVVVPLIHNDFDESYRFLQTRTGSSFMKLARESAGNIVEIPPVDFEPSGADVLRNSATFRYLYYETNAYLHMKTLISRYWWGGDEEWRPEFISSAVDIRRIRDHDSNRLFATYAIAEMKQMAVRDGCKLVFAMDGVREAIYAGKPVETYEVAKLNSIAADITRELKLPFLDLHQVFQRDFAANGQRFEFSYDWHWNEHANRLVGETLAHFLVRELGLTVRSSTAAAGRYGQLDRDVAGTSSPRCITLPVEAAAITDDLRDADLAKSC